ncbi:MAG TPA: nucleoside-diphosphate sugar epimerase/dehydratase [Fimbriimonadaceae bacterium]|nr:nucleoside-diphosphate sugar epimerase/dehydratase [Fimbriimonadaceae bacterium]
MNWKVIMEDVRRKPLSSWIRFARELSIDLLLVVASVWLTVGLAFDFVLPDHAVDTAWYFSLVCVGVAALVLTGRRLYSINARYVGLVDFLNIVLVGGVLATTFGLLERSQPLKDLPGSTQRIVLFGLLTISLLSVVRISQRIYAWRSARSAQRDGFKPKRTLIVGAGDAGEMIMREIARARVPNHDVVGFVDDDPGKATLRIHGVRVMGTTDRIPYLVKDLDIEELLIAMPSVHGEAMRKIIELCDQTGARVRTLPPVSAILSGSPHISQHLREVEIEDLLRRPPVKTDLEKIGQRLNGERIMITGGGGSIGSELARQIASLSPGSLILLGRGENSVYEIEQELVQTKGFLPATLVADVRDRQSMERAFDEHRPTVVFHAAAHKHVPLMQGNPIEAIRNNVLGTWLAAEMAIKYGAGLFIFISTDKAVKPTSVMGATKRVGEMIVSSLGQRSETDFAIVRFGNVMGSRGSLIPMLKAQIRRGGPVRVTHPEMTRYFMTIPEAVQLILQAGAIGHRGEVFLLDMGEAIPILNLAQDLIRLHGLVPGKDVDIQFTGVRPGEKIHEELLYDQEELSPTEHPKISMVKANAPDWETLRQDLNTLFALCDQGKATEAHNFLMELAWSKNSNPAILG